MKLKLDPANFEDTRYNNVYVDIKRIFRMFAAPMGSLRVP